jgi:TPR repeat protein
MDPARLADLAASEVAAGRPLDPLYDLACMLSAGRGGAPRLPDVAIATWKVLGRAGHARSNFILGVAYEEAIGVARDAPRTVRLYAAAAAAGELRAANNLAFMHMGGRGVPQHAPLTGDEDMGNGSVADAFDSFHALDAQYAARVMQVRRTFEAQRASGRYDARMLAYLESIPLELEKERAETVALYIALGAVFPGAAV